MLDVNGACMHGSCGKLWLKHLCKMSKIRDMHGPLVKHDWLHRSTIFSHESKLPYNFKTLYFTLKTTEKNLTYWWNFKTRTVSDCVYLRCFVFCLLVVVVVVIGLFCCCCWGFVLFLLLLLLLFCFVLFCFVLFCFVCLFHTIATDRCQLVSDLWSSCYKQVCLGIPEITNSKPQFCAIVWCECSAL